MPFRELQVLKPKILTWMFYQPFVSISNMQQCFTRKHPSLFHLICQVYCSSICIILSINLSVFLILKAAANYCFHHCLMWCNTEKSSTILNNQKLRQIIFWYFCSTNYLNKKLTLKIVVNWLFVTNLTYLCVYVHFLVCV